MQEQIKNPHPVAETPEPPSPQLIALEGGAPPTPGRPLAGIGVGPNQGGAFLRLVTMSKRGKAQGTIYRRKDRRWAIEMPHTASRRRLVRYAHTREEAEQTLEELRRQIDPAKGLNKNALLAEFLNVWLNVAMKPSIKQSTYEVFARVIKHGILPHLGDSALYTLTTERVQQFLAQLHERGASVHRQRACLGVLRLALGYAVNWGLLRANAARRVKAPKRPVTNVRYLQLDQIGTFLSFANRSRLYGFYVGLLATGARRSEIAALRYRDVDFSKRQVHIRRSLSELSTGLVFSNPKTEHSTRTVDLPQFAVDVLRDHRERMMAEGRDVSLDALVFVTRRGTPLTMSNVIRWSFRPILRAAGLPTLTLHGLRHTHATLLLRLRVSPKVVAERLGHASAETTLAVYAQTLNDDQDLALGSLESLFPKGRKHHV